MRAVVQRVAWARVEVDGDVVGAIDRGLLCYLGVANGDTQRDLDWLAEKVAGLRIFSDAEGKMNDDVTGAKGSVLVVSQFTLLGDCRKGRRPSFAGAMAPEGAERMVDAFVSSIRARGLPVATGKFRADMKVSSLNDGPVTLVIDSPRESDARNPGATSRTPSVGS